MPYFRNVAESKIWPKKQEIMTDEQKKLFWKKRKEGKVLVQTEEGIMTCPLEQFCKQGIEVLLYDLNRDEATTLIINNERAINDLAVAQVIRYLYEKAY